MTEPKAPETSPDGAEEAVQRFARERWGAPLVVGLTLDELLLALSRLPELLAAEPLAFASETVGRVLGLAFLRVRLVFQMTLGPGSDEAGRLRLDDPETKLVFSTPRLESLPAVLHGVTRVDQEVARLLDGLRAVSILLKDPPPLGPLDALDTLEQRELAAWCLPGEKRTRLVVQTELAEKLGVTPGALAKARTRGRAPKKRSWKKTSKG